MRSFRFALASAIVVLGLMSSACSSSSYDSPAPTPSPIPSPAPAPGGSSSSVTIPTGAAVLGDRAYNPDDINVAVGATVTWMNTDSVSHTSTSNASGWDSGIVAPGAQFSFAFKTAGTFRYHCAIHPGMIGTVVVQ
jgi:plastocyanin